MIKKTRLGLVFVCPPQVFIVFFWSSLFFVCPPTVSFCGVCSPAQGSFSPEPVSFSPAHGSFSPAQGVSE